MASRNLILMGQVVHNVKRNACKVRIRRMDLDQNLLMYFKKEEFLFAHDPEKKCKVGDIVLVKELPQKLSTLITHSVDVVYPFGDVTCPVTGQKVVVGKYRDQVEEAIQLYGKSDKAFDYKKAPPRGRQEGRRDFSHQETYAKYHDDGTDQPFAV